MSVCLFICPSVCPSVNFSYFRLLLKNHWANFNQTLYKASLGEGDSSFFQMKGPALFPRGDNYEIVKIHWQNLKIFFSWTTDPISTKLGTRHPSVKEIQVCSNKWPCSFPRAEPLSRFRPNLAQSILGWRGFKFDQMKGPALFQGEIITK